jgi:oxygen-independent coproporphyrinogen-3 oxidase
MTGEASRRTDELDDRRPAVRHLRPPRRSRPFRAGYLGRLLRRLVYHALVGREGWPVTFVAPSKEDLGSLGPSPHWYFHIPFCRSICPHCPYFKVPYSPSLVEAYRDAILRELRQYRDRHDRQPAASVYFGGGTPGLAIDTVEEVLQLCRDGAAPTTEAGIELHPRDCSRAMLARLRGMGVTKVSLGVESLDDRLLVRLGRHYTSRFAEAALTTALETGFECVDVNLIYGIPGQTRTRVVDDVSRCVALGATQISAYPLIAFQHTRMGKSVDREHSRVHDWRRRLDTQRLVTETLRHAGFDRKSIWSFTRPGVSPFTTVTRESYRGFGASAGSKVGGLFWFNPFSVEAYCLQSSFRPAMLMRAPERLRRFHWAYWAAYRTVIEPAVYKRLFGRDLLTDFWLAITLARLLGFLHRESDAWRLTDRGADWSHQLQSLYSLSFIDQLWDRCQETPWPEKVVLR